MLKRSFDVFFSVLLLIVLSPLFLLIAVAIRVGSRGPVFYRQRRTGRDLRPFSIVKFRTMAADSAGPAFTLADDPRVTPLGRWLRRTKLDELPQLWNILCGEMSFVGPRPILPELIVSDHPAYRQLYRVRPGLTDPASIKYADEGQRLQRVENPERYFHEVIARDKLRLSLDYQLRATTITDIVLLGQTILVCHRAVMADFQRPVPRRTPTRRPAARPS